MNGFISVSQRIGRLTVCHLANALIAVVHRIEGGNNASKYK
jgi:hypothetical protein